ncbi:M81 family metallopeptidase [Pseudoroseicyclus tamaricis]|uniref:Microcystinase C n=1 Tax=Pseudoroseicyclus tamaricis TaxID=2705421 RepID=A0A6B2JUG0_9RHOB|nr:M81 family metallopeptidase [Pseudoroseicyclus tamaricis]NDV00249.1 M81 family metallopeptidase [Pseudoroseicyclus tamaricis]
MPKRVLFAGLFHETHTFLAQKSDLSLFRRSLFHEGHEILEKTRGNASPADGFLSVADDQGWEVLPSIQMGAGPGGMVTEEVIETFEARFYADLERLAGEIDGIFLVLHGAMVSEERDDVEATILQGVQARLRAAGVEVPVVGVLDLHGNISDACTENSTMLVAYRENPHTDARATAVRAAGFLGQLMDGLKVSQVNRQTPYVLPPTGVGTAADPMRAMLARARAIEAEASEIVNINVMAGYAYADIPMAGVSFSAATTGDPAAAEARLAELEEVLTAHLSEGYPAEASLADALAEADALPPGEGPVLLIEPADNIGGGTPGDATGVLGPLLETGRTGIVAMICDPESVAACRAAGLGAEVDLMVGGKTDDQHGSPVPFAGQVRTLTDGRFELENKQSHAASMGGALIDMGPSAVVENGQAVILLTSIKTAPMDLGQLHSQGIAPEEAAYIVIKAAVSHKAAYDAIARAQIYVDSVGLCTSNLTRLPYRKLTGKRISLTATAGG